MTLDFLILGFNRIKKMLEDPKDRRLVVKLLQNSLDADMSKSTTITDVLLKVELETELLVKKIKTVIPAGINYHIWYKKA